MTNTPTATPKVRVPGDTSKAKGAVAEKLNVSLPWLESVSIIWPAIALEAADRNLLMDVADARGIHHYRLLLDIVEGYMTANRAALEAEADSLVDKSMEGMTYEEVEKKANLAQKQAEAAMARLSRLRALQTPPPAPAPAPPAPDKKADKKA